MSAPPSGVLVTFTLREEDITTVPSRTGSALDLVLPRRGDDPAVDPRWRTRRK
jgi:hypothetical protein